MRNATSLPLYVVLLLGMSAHALSTGVLAAVGLIVLSPGQQLVAAVLMAIALVVFRIVANQWYEFLIGMGIQATISGGVGVFIPPVFTPLGQFAVGAAYIVLIWVVGLYNARPR